MTAEEHAHVQELEGLVKRYRSKIVMLKTQNAGMLLALKRLVAGVERDDNPHDEGHCEHSDEMNAAREVIADAERSNA